MLARKSFEIWFSLNEAAVIDEMLQDGSSKHWGACSDFIQYYLEKQFPNLLSQLRHEVVQDTLFSVYRSLPTFRRESQFTTWIVSIARHRAIDTLRRWSESRVEVPMDDFLETYESDFERPAVSRLRTPEEEVLTHELMHETFARIEEFLQAHRKAERNRKILFLVLFDGLSQVETARKLGIPAPVVGAVVRAARAYLCQLFSPVSEK